MSNQINKIVGFNETKINPSNSNLFSADKKDIHVIIYCGYEGIEKLVFASTDVKETVNKILELKSGANINRLEAEKYSEEQREEMLDSDDVKIMAEYDRIFNGDNDPDRYCVMTFKDGKFTCACTDLGVPPKESWYY